MVALEYRGGQSLLRPQLADVLKRPLWRSLKSLGADCIAKEMRPEHIELLQGLLDRAGVTGVKPSEFKRYGSARTLYNFNIDNADAY